MQSGLPPHNAAVSTRAPPPQRCVSAYSSRSLSLLQSSLLYRWARRGLPRIRESEPSAVLHFRCTAVQRGGQPFQFACQGCHTSSWPGIFTSDRGRKQRLNLAFAPTWEVWSICCGCLRFAAQSSVAAYFAEPRQRALLLGCASARSAIRRRQAKIWKEHIIELKKKAQTLKIERSGHISA